MCGAMACSYGKSSHMEEFLTQEWWDQSTHLSMWLPCAHVVCAVGSVSCRMCTIQWKRKDIDPYCFHFSLSLTSTTCFIVDMDIAVHCHVILLMGMQCIANPLGSLNLVDSSKAQWRIQVWEMKMCTLTVLLAATSGQRWWALHSKLSSPSSFASLLALLVWNQVPNFVQGCVLSCSHAQAVTGEMDSWLECGHGTARLAARFHTFVHLYQSVFTVISSAICIHLSFLLLWPSTPVKNPKSC